MELQKPLFIALEGLRASGKSTLLKSLEAEVKGGRFTGYDNVVVTREVGGTAFGENVRQYFNGSLEAPLTAETEVLLINAARRENITQVIAPALQKDGNIVITDRWLGSTFAYQSALKSVPIIDIVSLHSQYCFGLETDLTICLEISPKEAIKRASNRESPIEDTEENLEILSTTGQGYWDLEWGLWRSKGTFRSINGMLDPDEVLKRAITMIRAFAKKDERPHEEGLGKWLMKNTRGTEKSQ